MTRYGFAAPYLAAGLMLAGSLAPGGARAMEFVGATENGQTVIVGSGDIRGGDAERLVVQLLVSPRGKKVVLALRSRGGNVVASESLASVVHRHRLPVVIEPGATCASACFLVFAASPHKAFFSDSRIGVHSASLDSRETLGTMAATTVMARSASDLGVPVSIIGKMVTTAPGDMAWLGIEELLSMGGELLDESPARKPPPLPPAAQPAASSAPAPSSLSGPPPGPVADAPAAPAALFPAASAPIPAPGASPAKPTRNGVPADEQAPSFQRGRADRIAWERWFATLAGDARLGAEYWTVERGKPRPGACAGTPEFQQACLAARQRLAGPDVKRKTDPQYWWGWNSL